ncbi:MAG: bifunctional 2-polyprenyl-6-hydroxyphenol methylase/3-demethylubiquinol 3-O-methyltransferase UbiG [Gammaproteobacteria bacterium]|nr:bifunctional 2-polyprenyl-6-hydroxyphenol methylase/3-demethylubiquinol 3-O-methyltransferase UbiG [Gammaproteobacteria bacterium]
MNYQEAEINKFDAVAPQWWDTNGPLKTLHQINPIRIKFILNNLDTTNLNNLNILDIGCGGGILSESLAALGANVTAIDLSTEAITVARLHAKSNNISNIAYSVTSIEDFVQSNPSLAATFDVITCMELLEHVPDPQAIIFNIKKLLKPNGFVFLSTLNRNPKSYLLSIIFAEYILNWLPRGTHEYNKFIKPSELSDFLRENNLKLNNLSGITYSLLEQKFVATTDIDVNYMACATYD